MEFVEFSAKTVDDCITEACAKFIVTSDKLEYEVVEDGKSGFLGLGSKPAVIKARVKEEEVKVVNETIVVDTDSVEDSAKTFLKDVLTSMGVEATIETVYNKLDRSLDIDIKGDDMGVLIGKRGQTLDSLQYLVSLVVNKGTGEYIRVKVDTENYRARRKATLENLAKNIAFKVKRTRRSVSLEPMNPYERRIIHSALQNDKYVTTHSEGEEPFRKVVVTLKK